MTRKTTFSYRLLCLKISLTLCFLFSCCTSFAQQWNILGNEQAISSVSSAYTSIAVLKNGNNFTPYVAFTESGVPKVKRRLADGTWEQVGENLGTNASYTRIYANSIGDLYVTYIDLSAGSKLAVKKFDTTTETWNPLNPEDGNSLYVSTGNANGMSAVGQYGSTQRCSMAFDSFNSPYIAFSEAGMIPYVKKFNETAWETVGTGAVSGDFAAAVGLAIDASDKIWLVYSKLAATNSSTGNMTLYGFDGGTWSLVSNNPIPTVGVRHTNIAVRDNDNICIAYFNTGSSNRATAILYNKTTNVWGTATTLASRDSPNISLINDKSGNLYCSFIDYTSSTNVFPTRVRFLAAGSTTWTELKDPAVIRGIDEPTGWPSIAIGNAPYPYVVYTKANSNNITTPIVRRYVPPPPPAELTTNNITNITTTTAVSGGNITSDGGQAITERGVVYSNSNPNPTTANDKVADVTGGTGDFSVTLTGLTPGTFYYARAYAINGGAASYGNTVRLNTLQVPDVIVTAPKQVEFLTRGLVAIQKTTNSVFLSWRLLGDDPATIAFNVYRNGIKINAAPVTNATNYTDATDTNNNTYSIKTVINGVEGNETTPVSVWEKNQLEVPLQIPPGGTLPDGRTYTYTANDASVGDVDGDGVYEIILKWDPTIVNDNAGGYSGKQLFDCYRLDGTRLWRIDLGINVNAGPHYNPFMVYDFDGDGKAEIILKTADGTIDGAGTVIGNATVDYRNTSGWVQQGPEFLTVFNGLTGAAMATITYQPARANTADWGDNYGNRQDRFVSAVAYLDGARPSIIVGRGYYNKLMRAAYDWRNGQLTLRWIFDSKDPAHPEYDSYSGQGNHQMTIGDVDGDGKDEIINGSSAINDDGKPLWTYGMGHGDALHMTDMDLDRPGQEIWICLESPGSYDGMGLRQYDAKTGETNWGIPTTGDVGRAMAADIDPNYKGYEMWGSSGDGTYDVKGNLISTNRPSYNSGIWWDGDLGRELLDRTYIDKWNPATKSAGRLFTIYQAAPISSNNSTKSNPALQADLFGDWREEVMYRKADNTALVIFTTNIASDYRIPTLMHDPQYRTAIAWQNSGYNQPPYTSYYIGYDMDVNNIPTAKIAVVDAVAPTVTAINRLTPDSEKNNAASVSYRVTFSENVSGVDTADFVLYTTGNVSGTIATVVAVTSTSFDVTVNNITGDGTLRLDINHADTGITDEANNLLSEGFTDGEIYTFDHTDPVITIPADLNINADNGSCEATNVILGTASASDTNTVEITNDAPEIFPVGITMVTWTATDAVGNSQAAIQKVTVTDAQKPEITQVVSQSFCYDSNDTYVVPILVATDNCGIDSISYIINGATSRNGDGNDASGKFNAGISTITWIVTDIHNNETTITSTITVNPPVSVTINDVYAINQNTDSKNTLYIGYGPSSFTITATVNSGKAPYTYNWSNGETTTSVNVNTAGTYSVIITDAKGCTATTSIVINVVDVRCGNKNDKVTMCHNGNAICVASSAVQSHLNHGDKLGSCETYSKINESSVANESAIKIYPNHTSGEFSIEINSLKAIESTITIATVNGQVIAQRDVLLAVGTQSFSFNISGKASGIYLIKVSSIEGVNTQNLLLKN
ncbi:T9SS type A sorting domain-containing protein [Flavobacterium sp. ST-87]|uniref:T9SS type A sorting domain-containing protein n=1 Tax=Flavobacterium plantiphilum TaxID=3163297 RepID=A0ABW8XR65_9FLAO